MYIIPTKISDVYTELSKFHLMSLMKQTIPQILITCPDLMMEETAAELDKLDNLGMGIITLKDPKEKPINCIVIGKTVIIPTINGEFGIVFEGGVYSIICDGIINTEAKDEVGDSFTIKWIRQAELFLEYD